MSLTGRPTPHDKMPHSFCQDLFWLLAIAIWIKLLACVGSNKMEGGGYKLQDGRPYRALNRPEPALVSLISLTMVVVVATAAAAVGSSEAPPGKGGATDEPREKRWRPWVHVAWVKAPTSTGPRPERPGPW